MNRPTIRSAPGRVAGRVVLDFIGTAAQDDTATLAKTPEVASAG